MGETRVDLLHLLEDLRDAYPGAVEETILTEIMANALDSGASTISFGCDPAERALTVIDNGSGMQRRALARFHDIASSNKIRGQGIGFAGVGIALTVAMSLAPLAVEPAQQSMFLLTFLTRWGEVLDKPGGQKRASQRG